MVGACGDQEADTPDQEVRNAVDDNPPAEDAFFVELSKRLHSSPSGVQEQESRHREGRGGQRPLGTLRPAGWGTQLGNTSPQGRIRLSAKTPAITASPPPGWKNLQPICQEIVDVRRVSEFP
jgi:hypothetical protein